MEDQLSLKILSENVIFLIIKASKFHFYGGDSVGKVYDCLCDLILKKA